MKILLVNDMGAPHGGAEMITLALRQGLRERGHDARLFASSAPSSIGPNLADYTCFGTISELRTVNRSFNLSAAVQLRRAVREFVPDIVHVRMFLSQLSPLILPVLAKVPALYHATWSETICPLGLKLLPTGAICHKPPGTVCHRSGCLSRRAWGPLMLQMYLCRRWLPVFDRIVANSHWLRDRLLEHNIGPIDVVWNGVAPVAQRPELRTPPVVTCAGRLVAEKGIDVLLTAFADVRAALPAAQLLVAGAGPERARLESLIRHLDLEGNVHLLGHLDKETLERSFAAGWVHVVPSLCAESFGMTAAEAMMRGTAVIGTNQGGLTEIITEGKTGLLVAPGDADALGEALLSILRDRECAEELGRHARARAERYFSQSVWIDQFLSLYASVATRYERK